MIRRSVFLTLSGIGLLFSAVSGDGDNAIDINYVGSTLWSNIRAVSVQGDYAFCAMQHGLMILDISDVANPEFVTKYYIPDGSGYDIVVIGTYAYMCCSSGGLQIFDISNVSSPYIVGEYSPDYWQVEYITIVGDYAYVTNFYHDEVDILNISDPTAPFKVGSYTSRGTVIDIIVQGNYMYCQNFRGLDISNISDPSAPDTTGTYSPPGTTRALALDDTLAYMINDSALHVVNVTDPANPQQVGYMSFGFSSFYLREIEIIGDYAYTVHGQYKESDGSGGIIIVDISDPTAPAIVTQMPQTAYIISRLGDRIGVSDRNWYFDILDISNPEAPTVAGIIDIPRTRSWGFRGVVTDGRYAYVSLGPSNIHIVDISDPAHPFPVAGDILPGGSFELARRGDYLYVASGSYDNEGLYIIDVSDPYSPLITGYYEYFSPQEITLEGDYAYMAGNKGYSLVLDISNPYSPELVAQYRTEGITWGIAVKGNYGYFANFYGILIMDFSNISEPVIVDTVIHSYQDFYDAIIYEGYLVTGSNGKFKVFDLTDPTVPVQVTELDFSGDVNGLTPYGNYIFAAVGIEGLVIIDMSTPTSPVVIGEQTISGEAQSIAFFDEYAYLVDQFGLLSFWVDLPMCCAEAGDANFDGSTDVGDAIFLINYIFRNGLPVSCRASADANGDCTIDIGDPVFLINHIFRSGPAPTCSECI
jgi:hypothetical protein